MIDVSKLPLDVTEQVVKFRKFLNTSYMTVENLMENHDWDDNDEYSGDWVQVNWEFLVERELLGHHGNLLPFDLIHRVTAPNAIANFKIVCKVDKSIKLIDRIRKMDNYMGEELFIVGFLTPHDDTFGLYPPFDYVDLRTIDRKKIYAAPLGSCRFYLEKNGIDQR